MNLEGGNILDTRNLQFEGDFDDQVKDILSFVRLTSERVHELRQLFDDLKEALQCIVPACRIEPFGSIVTGLGIKTSDVDCFVALPAGEENRGKGIIIRVKNVLNRFSFKFRQIVAITSAKVPIVKFLHVQTQCHCDVNFKSPAGVRNSELIAFLLHWDKRALPLAVLIKYWSKLHQFTGTNLMSNYALILMVIFYLQLMNILPSVYELQANVPEELVDRWNTAFDESMTWNDTRNSDTLYELMGGFFKCYSTFNYKDTVISPFMGRVITKKCFENFDVPPEFTLYKDVVSKDVRIKLKVDVKICIQDPFEHSRNCSVALTDRLIDRIISHFQFASKMFEESPKSHFLKAIFTQDPHTPPDGVRFPPTPIFKKIRKRKAKHLRGVPSEAEMRMMYNQYQNFRRGRGRGRGKR